MEKSKHFEVDRGIPLPYGVSKHDKGYNFSIFSKNAHAVSLCLFEPGKHEIFQEILLDSKLNKTGYVWHVFVKDLPPYFQYGYRLDGTYDPFKGLYYDRRHIVLDPFAKQVVSSTLWGGKHYDTEAKKGVVDPFHGSFSWENDVHPNIPLKDLVIYEMHVRGFTKSPSSNASNPGTFLAIIEKIPYLKSLGVNAIELLPIFEFNENENIRINPLTKEHLFNYWGYSTVNFFSLMNRYVKDFNQAINEFKTLVKTLHANGIEVILDVVYNHTSEGGRKGPTHSFKGIENCCYYILGPNGEYYNYSGCGNTMNANHPFVRKLILASLRYWVQEMHVDGFRFDLASILTRSTTGSPLENPPLVESITFDPLLANTKLIAEAWDAAGLYQVGSFPSWGVWAEWNGKYRDDVREFIKGTDGKIGSFATRLSGSADLYGKGRKPFHSINFVTSHDGFSLRDLVSYNSKHNESNGENNQDGDNNNLSWNCGKEGETENPEVLNLRQRQMRNFHLALMVSQGVPMVLMGDEYGHTKKGNNNTWPHDDSLNWFAWDQLEKNQGFYRFYTSLIHFRNRHSVLRQTHFLNEDDVIWHGLKPMQVDWSEKSRFLAMTLIDRINNFDLYIAFNMGLTAAEIELPAPRANHTWLALIDTSKSSPEDFVEEENANRVIDLNYTLSSYSSLLLKSKP